MSSRTKKKDQKGHKSSASERPSGWSEWEYYEPYKCEIRSRVKRNGELDYEYRNTQPGTVSEAPDDVPRTPGALAEPGQEAFDADDNPANLSNGQPIDPSYGYGRQTTTSDLANDFSRIQVSSRPYETAGGSPSYMTRRPSASGSQPNGYAENPVANPGENASSHRPESNGSIRHIKTEDTTLHKDFKLHHSKYFKFGHIFKIVWVEPMGQDGRRRPQSNRTFDSEIKSKFGELAYASIRRFLIVREQEGHCICLPILTYKGQGTTKNGVKSAHHAIIYMENKKEKSAPTEAPGEQTLPNTPVCVKRKNPYDKLDPLSRLNYAKMYTVEHNSKVSFIGKVSEESRNALIHDYNKINQLLYQGATFPEETPESVAEATDGAGAGLYRQRYSR